MNGPATKLLQHVVVVGGGATGVAAFIALVDGAEVERVSIVDPGEVGVGVAFNATDSSLLCNTSVDTLSVVPGVPDDFERYVDRKGAIWAVRPFIPRCEFGRYLRERYSERVRMAESRGIKVAHLRDRVVEVRCHRHGSYQVILGDGTALEATEVLICLGYTKPRVPAALEPHVGQPGIVECPYPEANLNRRVPEHGRVLVLGTRLSALDSTLVLTAEGRDRLVTLASPSGTFPAVRTATPRTVHACMDAAAFRQLDFADRRLPHELIKLLEQGLSRITEIPLGEQLSKAKNPVTRLKEETALAAAGQTHWQNILVEVVDLANDTLVRQPRASREAAMKSCEGIMVRYLGAFALSSAQALVGLIESGRADVREGVLKRVRPVGGNWRVDWEGGGADTFDAIVSAAGFKKPPIHLVGDTLHVAEWGARVHSEPEINPDLRLQLPERPAAERVWMLGISSHMGVPLVNAVYQAARQAEYVAKQFRQLADSI